MTPNDIATNVAGLSPVGNGNVNWSTQPTYSYSGGAWVADDQRSWD